MTETTTQNPQERIREALANAKGITWDGCHKIYVLMDDEQVSLSDEMGYDVFLMSDLGIDAAYAMLRGWFDVSCSLRFISAVKTVEGDPNEGYTNLIAQFELPPRGKI